MSGRIPKWVRFMLPPKYQVGWEGVPRTQQGTLGCPEGRWAHYRVSWAVRVWSSDSLLHLLPPSVSCKPLPIFLLCPVLLASENTDVPDTCVTMWALPTEAPRVVNTDRQLTGYKHGILGHKGGPGSAGLEGWESRESRGRSKNSSVPNALSIVETESA